MGAECELGAGKEQPLFLAMPPHGVCRRGVRDESQSLLSFGLYFPSVALFSLKFLHYPSARMLTLM